MARVSLVELAATYEETGRQAGLVQCVEAVGDLSKSIPDSYSPAEKDAYLSALIAAVGEVKKLAVKK